MHIPWTKIIFSNQLHTGLQPAYTWFRTEFQKIYIRKWLNWIIINIVILSTPLYSSFVVDTVTVVFTYFLQHRPICTYSLFNISNSNISSYSYKNQCCLQSITIATQLQLVIELCINYCGCQHNILFVHTLDGAFLHNYVGTYTSDTITMVQPKVINIFLLQVKFLQHVE